VEVTAEYAVEEKKLKKSIGRLDILFFLLCTIVGSTPSARRRHQVPRRSRG
jgi:hypothetical protein